MTESFIERMRRIRNEMTDTSTIQPTSVTKSFDVFPFKVDMVIENTSMELQIHWVSVKIPYYFQHSNLRTVVEPLLTGVFASAIDFISNLMQHNPMTSDEAVTRLHQNIHGTLHDLQGKVKPYSQFVEQSHHIVETFPDASSTPYYYDWEELYKVGVRA